MVTPGPFLNQRSWLQAMPTPWAVSAEAVVWCGSRCWASEAPKLCLWLPPYFWAGLAVAAGAAVAAPAPGGAEVETAATGEVVGAGEVDVAQPASGRVVMPTLAPRITVRRG